MTKRDRENVAKLKELNEKFRKLFNHYNDSLSSKILESRRLSFFDYVDKKCEEALKDTSVPKVTIKVIGKEFDRFIDDYNKVRRSFYKVSVDRRLVHSMYKKFSEKLSLILKFGISNYEPFLKYVFQERLNFANSQYGRRKGARGNPDDSNILGYITEKRILKYLSGTHIGIEPKKEIVRDHAGFSYGEEDTVSVDGFVWKGYDIEKNRDDLAWLTTNGRSLDWKENDEWKKLFTERKSVKQRKLYKIMMKKKLGVLTEQDIDFLWDHRDKMEPKMLNSMSVIFAEKYKELEELMK